MEDFIKPNKVEEEIILDAGKVIMCKTNKEGIFEFANEYFMEVSGYEEYELMGKSMFCIQHPDMPEVIFKMMWEKLLAKENFSVVIKNIAKTGKFYWSVTNFDFKIDEKDEIVAIYSKRVAASRASIAFFSKLYKTLLRIEKENGINAAEKYLNGYLEEKRMNFKELVQQFYDNLETNTIPKAKTIKIETPKPQPHVVEEKTPNKENIEVSKKPIVETKPKEIEKIEKKKEQVVKKVPEVKKSEPVKIEKKVEVPKTNKPKVEKDIKKKEDTPKKSLFQKLFGKTDEEIEEERRRREKEKR